MDCAPEPGLLKADTDSAGRFGHAGSCELETAANGENTVADIVAGFERLIIRKGVDVESGVGLDFLVCISLRSSLRFSPVNRQSDFPVVSGESLHSLCRRERHITAIVVLLHMV